MSRTTQTNSILVCALVGVMVAGQAMAATIKYQNSGNYTNVLAVTPANGWQAGGTGPGGLPGTADTIRFNYASNTVTLTNFASTVTAFQAGVDESGGLVVNSGGILTATGSSTVGNNAGGSGANLTTGFLTINSGGTVNNGGTLKLGAGASTVLGNLKGIVTINGGALILSNHLWVGSSTNTIGTINITNDGVLTIVTTGMFGLGGGSTTSASGGQGFVNVQDGGRLNLFNIHPTGSIWPGSKLDISGSGVVTVLGDKVSTLNGYITAGRITANAGLGTVGVDYNNTNSGKTTLYVAGYVPPTAVVWNPAGNPSGTGKWNEVTNWTGFLGPTNVTKVTLNVAGAIPCTVTNAAFAKHVVMGDNGPGGTLIITNGGSLTASSASDWSAIGYNSNALMVVENGGSVSFGSHLWIGFSSGSDGTLLMKGGTVTVSNMIGLGWNSGKGTVQANGGTVNLLQWDDTNSIKGASVLDVTATGRVVISGNRGTSVSNFISSGKITAYGGTGTVVVDYNNTNPGKTTLTANRVPTGSDIYTTVGQGDAVTIPIIGGKYAPMDADPTDIPNLIVSAVGGTPTRGTASFTSTNVTYTSSGASSGTDSFTYTVSDQRGGTVTQTVHVTVTAGGNGANIVPGSLSVSGPLVSLQASGLPLATYRLQFADSLASPIVWSDMFDSDTVAATNGVLNFSHTATETLPGTGFFRTKFVSGPP